MLDRIKKAIFATYNPEEKKGVFISGFSDDRELVFSEWVVHTDRPIREVIESLYENFVQDQLTSFHFIVCDIVAELIDLPTTEEILQLDPAEYGFLVVSSDGEHTGVMLPNTQSVGDVKTALYNIQQKYGISGSVEVFAFRTERVVIEK